MVGTEKYQKMSTNLQSTINTYERYISKTYNKTKLKNYWVLDTGGVYKYIFNSEESIQKLQNRINGDSFKRKIGYTSLKYSSKINTKLLKYIPQVSHIKIKTPIENPLEYAIIGPKGVFMLTEYVFITAEEKIINKECRILTKLPDSVNFPKLYKKSDKYYTQEKIPGKEATSINKSTRDVEKGFNQIKPIYKKQKEKISINDVIHSIEQSEEISKYYDNSEINEIIQKAIDYGLPESINKSYIHGDFKSKNILITENKIYIIDWSDYRFDYSIFDLYLSYHNLYISKIKYHKNPFKELINKEGTYHEQHKKFINNIGKYMYNEKTVYSGIPIIYLLLTIDSYNSKIHIETAIEILNDVLNY